MKKRRMVLIAGSVLVLAVVTLGPLGLRPETGLPHQVERGLVFMLFGFLVAAALRPLWLVAAAGVITVAAVLELLQLLLPDRDGRLLDFIVKATGGCAGVLVAMAGEQVLGWLLRARRAPPHSLNDA